MKKPVTIYDIAVKLKLTASTVSRALNGNTEISETTRKRVLEAARQMKYRQNVNASNLRTGRKKTLGIIVPQINNSFFSSVIAGIEESTFTRGFNLLICQSDESFEKEIENIRMLTFQNVACIIISLAKTTADTAHLQEVIDQGIPLIQFDRTDKRLKSIQVLNNNVEAAKNAVKHLYEQGYRNLGFLSGPKDVNIFKERLQGFRKGMQECGLKTDDGLIAFDCLDQKSAAMAVKKWLRHKNPPDAVLAAADLAALGALQIAKEAKKKVPAEFGVCGFSNEPYTELTSPTLSTVNQFSFEMGLKIGELVAELESGKKNKIPVITTIETALVIRDSSARTISSPQ